MKSAFGVEHVSKGFSANALRMDRALATDTKLVSHNTLDEKLRRHAVRNRLKSGGNGTFIRSEPGVKKPGTYPLTPGMLSRAREQKVASHGMYSAISRNNRKQRFLP